MKAAMRLLFILPVLALFLGACTPVQQVHGYIPNEDELAALKPGKFIKRQVAEKLGSPTAKSTFPEMEGETWYYITRRTERLTFFDEKLIEQTVVAIDFDDKGILKDIRRYTSENGRDIKPVDRKTPTRGKELTILEQLFGNFGRFNKDTFK